MIPRQASAPGHVALPAARQTGALAAKLPDLPLQADFDAVICVLRGDAHTGNELAQAMRSLGLDAAEPAAQQAALAWVFDRIVDEAPLLDPPLLGELVRALGSALGGPGMTEAEIDSFFLQLASCAPQLSSQQLSDAVAAFGLALDIAHVDASRERLFQQVAGLAATAPLASVTAWASGVMMALSVPPQDLAIDQWLLERVAGEAAQLPAGRFVAFANGFKLTVYEPQDGFELARGLGQ